MKSLLVTLLLCSLSCVSKAADGATSALHPGLRNLATKAYSPAVMDPVVFANLWRSWDKVSREAAEKAPEKTRREMTLKRYGLVEAPFDNGGAPLGMVVRDDGSYAMSCLVCHAGSVAGKTVLGLPNASLDFSGIYEDTAATYTILHSGKPGNPAFPKGLLFLAHGEVPPTITYPEGLLGASRGNVNSFTFSVYFLSLRDKDLNVLNSPLDLKPHNHYLDPPPLWNVAKKQAFYSDGFTPKTIRALMQFSLDPAFDPALFKSWEGDYKEISAWMNTLESPKYPGAVDAGMAARGRAIYDDTCARCHGVPGRGGDYKNKVVPIDVVQTDRARLDSLSPEFKQHFLESWMGYYGRTEVTTHGTGYVAPPLDGAWATAPYFHNGSVPTLYHVLFPDERPAVWKVKNYDSYDHTRVGLLVEELKQVPETSTLSSKREYFDSSRETLSNKGHRFADGLARDQRLSLLEYLKTL